MIKIIKLIICIVAGYIAGSLNPAAVIAKLKKTDLRKKGTGNLGATNVMLIFGKAAGAFVMLFDIAKAFIAAKVGGTLCSEFSFAGIAAGTAAVIGHIFPFYLKFKGGKGLAPFAGMVLAVDPILFWILLPICIMLMLIVNYSVAMPYSAALLFTSLSIWRSENVIYIIIAALVSSLILYKHFPNLIKAIQKKDIRIREYIKNSFIRKA